MGYGKRTCGCKEGTYRKIDMTCVYHVDCVPEGRVTEEQRKDMETARKLLNGTNRLTLFYDVNAYAKQKQDMCWSSTKSDTLNAGGIRHKLIYIENGIRMGNEEIALKVEPTRFLPLKIAA
ncbi:uncharacterized protein LOC142568148 [Dermacentor variabilis]|uniref:uncharacterized protein LOC142568148 n=1 Tax=Dermacentor variabilis TaxID=34621 RepID=UPI003F5C2E11